MSEKPGASASGARAASAKSPKYPIDSVVNAGRILELFTGARELRLTDVADSLGVSPSTAHRLLTSMEARRLVEQNTVTRCYQPGPGLLEIAQALVPAASPWTFARPYLAALGERVGATVNLLLRHDTQVSFAESVEASSTVRVGSRLGAVMPAHATSGGKVLLASLSQDELLRLYPQERITHPLGGRELDRAELFAALHTVARAGYATNFSETEPGISGVAVEVRTGSHPDFALAVSVPAARIDPPQVQALVGQLRMTADALRQAISASPSGRPEDAARPERTSARQV